MRNTKFKAVLLLLLLIVIFSRCANDDSYDRPGKTLETYTFTPTTTVEAVKASATETPVIFTTDDIIEAYVTSSDEKGNFYKSISFQTLPADGAAPIGFSVPINGTTLYGKGFTPGRKVYIKLRGLYSAIVYGALQIGSLNDGTIGRLSEFEWKDYLYPSSTIVSEDILVRTLSLTDAYTDENQNTLVELDGVQFSDSSINRTYYDIDSGGGATNHALVSSGSDAEGIIRISSFCSFSGKQVPTLSGKIRGVLTKYDTDFQFIIRYESDIRLTEARFDSILPLGGTELTYFGVLNETFTSYAANASIFPKYINDAAVGSRYWQVKTFGGNKYIQMSAFGGKPEINQTAFILPVDFTAASHFSFKTLAGYDNGSPLKVYYTTDYIAGNVLGNATLIDITYAFSISKGPAAGYAASFTSSGIYDIPDVLTGNGYFVFEYSGNGNGGVTTTMEIDDIIIN